MGLKRWISGVLLQSKRWGADRSEDREDEELFSPSNNCFLVMMAVAQLKIDTEIVHKDKRDTCDPSVGRP